MHRMITTIEVTSESNDKHDDAVVRDPAFVKLHLEVAQAISSYIASSLKVSPPKISGHIVSVRHEGPL